MPEVTIENQSGGPIFLKPEAGDMVTELPNGQKKTGNFDGYWDPARPNSVYKIHDLMPLTTALPFGEADPLGPDYIATFGPYAGWKDSAWISERGDWEGFVKSSKSEYEDYFIVLESPYNRLPVPFSSHLALQNSKIDKLLKQNELILEILQRKNSSSKKKSSKRKTRQTLVKKTSTKTKKRKK